MVESVVVPAVGLLLWISKRYYAAKMQSGLFQAIPAALTLLVTLWGVFLWAIMSAQCFEFYSLHFLPLLLLFYLDVILLVAGILIACTVILMVFGSLGFAIAHKGKV